MISYAMRMFGRRKQAEPYPESRTMITPESVEALIEKVGREKVLKKMRDAGWSRYDSPPLWVWQLAAVEVMQDRDVIRQPA